MKESLHDASQPARLLVSHEVLGVGGVAQETKQKTRTKTIYLDCDFIVYFFAKRHTNKKTVQGFQRVPCCLEVKYLKASKKNMAPL